MPEAPIIVALIPAYNAEPFVGEVVRKARAHVPAIAVSDGSKDGTLAQLNASGATAIDQQPNQGKGVALRRGYQAALEQRAEAVIQLDADGQHDPTEIPLFVDKYRATAADLIIG